MSFDKALALNAAKEYMLQGNHQAAIEVFLKIIEADPEDLASINALGDLYVRASRVEDAVSLFSKLADGYLGGGFMRKAIAVLKKVMAIDPGNTGSWIKLADVYAKAGLPTEARQHYLQIAEAYRRRGEMREALEVFGKVVDLDPSNASTRIKLGELYLRERMNDQAYEAFISAAAQLASRGERRRALNAYNEALAIRPDSVEALTALSRLTAGHEGLSNKPSLTAALGNSMFEAAMSSGNLDPVGAAAPPATVAEDRDTAQVVHDISKAEILVAYGQVDQAIAMLKEVVRKFPDNIDVRVKLKDIYLRNGMTAEGAYECRELERIHRGLGEDARARDYAVRASRLTQLIEQPSGDLREAGSESSQQSAPALVTQPPVPAKREESVPVRPGTHVQPMPAVASQVQVTSGPVRQVRTLTAVPESRPVITSKLPETVATLVASSSAEVTPISIVLPEVETSLAPPPIEQAIQETPQLLEAPPVNALTRIISAPPAPVKKRSRFTVAAIAAGVVAVLGTGAVIGGFVFDKRLNKQYESLTMVAPPENPQPAPAVAASSETDSAPAVEPITVEVTPRDKPDQQSRNEPPEIKPTKNEQPARVPAEQPKEIVKPLPPAPAPPRTAVNPDSHSVGENRTPAGVPVSVPTGVAANAPAPAEPPAKPPRVSEGVVLGGAIKRVEPAYPPGARAAQQSGTVRVEVSIDERGSVTSARAQSGPPLLQSAAVMAARGFKFRPSTLGGVPVKTSTVIVFNFKL